MRAHVPDRGAFISITLDPQSGHEQRGRRPALVLSHQAFNQRTGFCIACPITNTVRPFPFHIEIPKDQRLTGFVMVDQVKSLDYTARDARSIGRAPQELLDRVLATLDACIF